VDIQYDAVGRRTLLRHPNGVTTAYDYDAASRLTRLTYTSPSSLLGDLAYQYDPAGNRIAVGGSFARTLLPNPVPSATYDVANQQLAFGSRTMAYDANGNLTGLADVTGTTTFTWDARNRLTAVSGSGATGTFTYDAQGRRVGRVIGGEPREYQYDGPDIARERVNGIDANYLRTLEIDEAVCRIESGGTTCYLADALGGTVALADDSGAIATTYSYEPFGRTASAGALTPNPFQYTGRENEGSGLYYYRARYYHPTLHRWISEDPIGLLGGDVNLYAYVGNNPTAYVDPLGLRLGILRPRWSLRPNQRPGPPQQPPQQSPPPPYRLKPGPPRQPPRWPGAGDAPELGPDGGGPCGLTGPQICAGVPPQPGVPPAPGIPPATGGRKDPPPPPEPCPASFWGLVCEAPIT
jgi:RHS repeat-associated protein